MAGPRLRAGGVWHAGRQWGTPPAHLPAHLGREPRLAALVAAPVVLLVPWGYPAATLLALSVTSLALLIAMRAGLYPALRAAYRRGRLTEAALIVGTGHTGLESGQILLEHPELGLRPVGLLGGPPRMPEPALPVLGDLPDMSAVVAR